MTFFNKSSNRQEPPLAAGGGMRMPQVRTDDPIRALDDLMAVVEALCPIWPERVSFVDGGKILL